MSNKIDVVQVVGKAKKTLHLTAAEFKETITTEKKRARFRAGRLVRVRQDGKVLKYKKAA